MFVAGLFPDGLRKLWVSIAAHCIAGAAQCQAAACVQLGRALRWGVSCGRRRPQWHTLGRRLFVISGNEASLCAAPIRCGSTLTQNPPSPPHPLRLPTHPPRPPLHTHLGTPHRAAPSWSRRVYNDKPRGPKASGAGPLSQPQRAQARAAACRICRTMCFVWQFHATRRACMAEPTRTRPSLEALHSHAPVAASPVTSCVSRRPRAICASSASQRTRHSQPQACGSTACARQPA